MFSLFLLFFTVIIQKIKSITIEPTNITRDDGSFQLDIFGLTGSLQNPTFLEDGSALVITQYENGYNQGPANIVLYSFSNKSYTYLVKNGYENFVLPGIGSVKMFEYNLFPTVLFASSSESHNEIYLINTDQDSGDEDKITDRDYEEGYYGCYNPDGDKIVFESHTLGETNDGIITIYNIKNEFYTSITSEEENCKKPSWNPAGNEILYQREKIGSSEAEIYIINTNPPYSPICMTCIFEGEKKEASWSIDGDKILLSHKKKDVDTFFNIYQIKRKSKGKVLERLTENANGEDGSPAYSHDSTYIAFESCLSGTRESGCETKIWIKEIIEKPDDDSDDDIGKGMIISFSVLLLLSILLLL